MRLGVIDVGSNTVHLLVVDAHRGAQPLPATSHKIELRLSEHVTDSGDIAGTGEAALTGFIHECLAVAEDQGVEEVMAFVTSAIREAPNGEDVLARVRSATGVALQVLSGEDEARLTFLAARRWFGWSSGTLLVVDIGGGSLELAAGMDEEPDAAVSLPLGAGRLTRDLLPGDPPGADVVREARRASASGSPPPCDRSPRPAPPTARSAPPRRCARWPASPVPRRAATARMPRAASSARRSPRSSPTSAG